MVLVVTLAAAALALLAHLVGWDAFGDPTSVPITGVVAICTMGVLGRIIANQRRGLVAMVPRILPTPELFVWFTGLCELAGGIGVLVPVLRPWAAGCLVVLLVAVFPANIRHEHLRGDADGSFGRRIVLRAAEQVVYLAFCTAVLIGSLR